jgi:hypothetical protein
MLMTLLTLPRSCIPPRRVFNKIGDELQKRKEDREKRSAKQFGRVKMIPFDMSRRGEDEATLKKLESELDDVVKRFHVGALFDDLNLLLTWFQIRADIKTLEMLQDIVNKMKQTSEEQRVQLSQIAGRQEQIASTQHQMVDKQNNIMDDNDWRASQLGS